MRDRWCLPIWIGCCLLVSSFLPCAVVPGAEPIPKLGAPFDLERLSVPPAVTLTEDHAAAGVQALYYAGVPYQGKPTQVFAYLGMPADATPDQPVPAMVLIHGGGGTAFDRWVKVWTARGYAAISMDLCGCVPVRENNAWQRNPQGGPPGWGASFQQLDDPVADQWGWHAVSAAVLAHSLLRNDPRIDANRIGVTGISWGGYLTSIVAGVDSRFRFAAPVYGCGFLADNSTWLQNFEQLGPVKAPLWVRQWDPSSYLGQAAMPMLWVNGTNDFAYPMDSWQKSYRLPTGPRTLCLRIRMPHGHGPAGENPEEIHVLVNHILKGAPGLPQFIEQGEADGKLWATYKSPVAITKAELSFTKGKGRWQDRLWEAIPAEVDHDHSKISAAIPADATVYYLNLFDDRNCVVSTEHVER